MTWPRGWEFSNILFVVIVFGCGGVIFFMVTSAKININIATYICTNIHLIIYESLTGMSINTLFLVLFNCHCG